MSRKFALIIGNSQYDDANLLQLTAPAADVRALDELLRAPEIGGFDAVQTLENRPFAEVHPAIADFFADKKPDDLLLLYFSGHGLLDPQGRLYLAVKNTRNDRLSGSAIASLFLKDEMDNSRAKRQVLILDCCQSGAFGQGTKGAPGTQAITDATFEGRGRVVLTATDKTQPAWEGNRIIGGVETSIFTHFIIEGLKTGAAADEGGRITPTRLYEYVFPKVVEVVPTQKPRLIVYDREGGDIVIARSPRPPASNLLTLEHPFHLELIRIPAGEFLMGSDPAKDKGAQPDEQPQHRVYVSEFYIGKYPITNAQYAVFRKIQIPPGKESHPVVNITWRDAVTFCERLSEETGKRFRLPTEAEWEKAARGTDGRIYPWGNEWDAKRLNSKESKIGGTTPVGQYSPAGDSPYGLADMSGNVWEWCADWSDEEEYQRRDGSTVKDPQGPKTGKYRYRACRGGSWHPDEEYASARVAARGGTDPGYDWITFGFRVAASLD